MKKLFVLSAASAFFFQSCADPKARQKALIDDILKSHDKVMADAEKAQFTKMKLDTLLQHKPDLKVAGSQVINEITAADSSMEEWMQKFDPEFKGKSTEEVVTYLSTQKSRLSKVDSQLQSANSKATQYLTQHH